MFNIITRRSLIKVGAGMGFLAFIKECLNRKAFGQGQARPVFLAEVWSGTSVSYGSASDGKTLLAAYYNVSRYLEIVNLNIATNGIEHIQLLDRFEGWDAHRNTVVKFSSDGAVHVLADMHDSPLVYFKSRIGDKLKEFSSAYMIGRNEEHVTYPTFLDARGEDLYFYYRDGASGAGTWFINAYRNGSWQRCSQMFAGGSSADHVSAYPSNIVLDGAGFYHVAVVWRKNADVASNYKLTYTRSKDFVSWLRNDGSFASGPVSPEDSISIDEPGQNTGLLNNARIVITDGLQPTVFYTKYSNDGTNALIAAQMESVGWRRETVTSSNAITKLEGGGSIAMMPRFHAEASSNHWIRVVVSFPYQKEITLLLDPHTLQKSEDKKHETSLDKPVHLPKEFYRAGPKDGVTMVASVGSGVIEQASDVGKIVWRAQRTARDTVQASSPPSRLYFVPNA